MVELIELKLLKWLRDVREKDILFTDTYLYGKARPAGLIREVVLSLPYLPYLNYSVLSVTICLDIHCTSIHREII